METEPTAENRQRQAFQLLRNHARNAHIAGDGLLVGVLCHTGLYHVRCLAEEKRLLLPFSEIVWIPVLALYWLVDPSEQHVIDGTLKHLEHQSDEDLLVAQWVDRYRSIISQPLADDAQLEPTLKEFMWPESFVERSPEVEALISHLVELAWFNGPTGDHWRQLVDIWLRTAPKWSHAPLAELKRRLELQARLTSPDKLHAIFLESDAEKLRAYYDLAELWLLHLYGRFSVVCESVERLAPFLSAESHRWRVLQDFLHFGSLYGSRDGESQGVRLARRRRLSVETPLLVFLDQRESRMTRTLGELFRSRSKGAASKRWDVYILARLHEIAVLRLWDYGMWVNAIRAQAQVSLEVVQWTDAHPGLSEQGLLLAVRSFSAAHPEKDSSIRRGIDTLEFAPTQVLERFGESLLATYPTQKHSAAGLLEDITDLLPPKVWPELAHWTMSYVQESSEQRTGGWQAAPAAHWLHVLPVLPQESEIWATLQPEALRMAKISYHWRGDNEFLLRWLLFAPLPFAREIAEVLLSHSETDSSACLARAETLINFEEWNPILQGNYTRRLLPAAHSAIEDFILAKHLEEPNIAEREAVLRERLAQKMRSAIAQATPDPSVKQFSFSPVMGVHLVSHWRVEDQLLLEELIAAVNSPDVLDDYLPWLITTIQTLVSDGPVEFSELVQPHIVQWTHQLPSGRKIMGGDSSPLSIMQWNNGGDGEVALSLGWLAFQIPRKLGPQSHSLVLTWIREMLLIGEARPLDMAIYGSAVVALQMSSTASAEPLSLMETAIVSLSVRLDSDPSATQNLADALVKVASLIDSEHFMESANGESPKSADALVEVLSRHVPKLAKSTRASLRAAVAALVWQLEKHQGEESWVVELLESLQQDNRARVRFEAYGGWKEARAKAVVNGR